LNKGELEKAARVFDSIQKLIDSEEAPILVKVRGKNLEFIYYAHKGSRNHSLKAIEECLQLLQLTGVQLDQLLILHDGAWASYYFNEVAH